MKWSLGEMVREERSGQKLASSFWLPESLLCVFVWTIDRWPFSIITSIFYLCLARSIFYSINSDIYIYIAISFQSKIPLDQLISFLLTMIQFIRFNREIYSINFCIILFLEKYHKIAILRSILSQMQVGKVCLYG